MFSLSFRLITYIVTNIIVFNNEKIYKGTEIYMGMNEMKCTGN